MIVRSKTGAIQTRSAKLSGNMPAYTRLSRAAAFAFSLKAIETIPKNVSNVASAIERDYKIEIMSKISLVMLLLVCPGVAQALNGRASGGAINRWHETPAGGWLYPPYTGGWIAQPIGSDLGASGGWEPPPNRYYNPPKRAPGGFIDTHEPQ